MKTKRMFVYEIVTTDGISFKIRAQSHEDAVELSHLLIGKENTLKVNQVRLEPD